MRRTRNAAKGLHPARILPNAKPWPRSSACIWRTTCRTCGCDCEALADEPGFHIRVTEDRWHFEDVVYSHQVKGDALEHSYKVDASVSDYNRLLCDSIFALCPAGAGPNSLRLWEALATGAIPVLLGPQPALPTGGTLPPIDWDDIVLRVPDPAIPDLPGLLRALPVDELRRRQRQGMQAYRLVQSQCCF